jgi:hypothetical protein
MTLWMKTRLIVCAIVAILLAATDFYSHGLIVRGVLMGLAGAIGVYIAMTWSPLRRLLSKR